MPDPIISENVNCVVLRMDQLSDDESNDEIKSAVREYTRDLATFVRVLTEIKPHVASALCRELAFTSVLEQLRNACQGEEAIGVTGVGPKTVESILEMIDQPKMLEAASSVEERMERAYFKGIDVSDFKAKVDPAPNEIAGYNTYFRANFRIDLIDNGGFGVFRRGEIA